MGGGSILKLNFWVKTVEPQYNDRLETESVRYTEKFGILKVVHFLWTTHLILMSSTFMAILQGFGGLLTVIVGSATLRFLVLVWCSVHFKGLHYCCWVKKTDTEGQH